MAARILTERDPLSRRLEPLSPQLGTVFRWNDLLSMFHGELKPDRKPRDLSLRERLWTDRDRRCEYCQRKIRLKSATLDHVVAKVNGGSDLPSNKVLCCKQCNSFKGSRSPEQFLANLRSMIKSVESIIPAVRSGEWGVA